MSPLRPALAQAAALFQQGRHSEADALLTPIVAAAPRDHAALHLLGIVARERGDTPRAIDLLRRAADLGGRNPAYQGNLGNAYLTAEMFEPAAHCYRRVLMADPAAYPARFGLGMARLGQRNFAAAAAELARVVAARPDHVDAEVNLGTALSELGRHIEAAAHMERVLRKSDHAGIHLHYARVLRRQGDRPRALHHLRRAVQLDPGLPDAHYHLGCVLQECELVDEAAASLSRAVSLAPNMAAARCEYGQVLNRLQQFDAAARQFDAATALDPRHPAPHLGLARTRHLQGRCAEAADLISQAQALGADPVECHTMLGLVQQTEGRFDAASASFAHAIALAPGTGQAQLCLTLLRPPPDPGARIAELERLLALAADDPEQHATLGYAVAKEYERAGRHDAAFASYRAANATRQVQHAAAPIDAAAAATRIEQTFTPAFFADRAALGSPSERPVFIVGMMRSGTTLVEQILASHPDVHGHGEIDDMRRIAHGLATGMADAYPERLGDLDPPTIAARAAEYLARLEHDAPGAIRSIDKLPQNLEQLGLIGLLFPRARIIHCTRDPVDTCLSNYVHDFGAQNPFTRDLESLGRHHRHYDRLMAHFRAVLPNPILQIPYEQLVADPEGWSRRAVAFLGLPWNPGCLAFHATDRAVHTYSLWQVRQPIYTAAIERWRPYAGHLGPLFQALGLPLPATNL